MLPLLRCETTCDLKLPPFSPSMQTWEYSSQFALRSYLYLLLHAPAAAVGALLGSGRGESLGGRGSRGVQAAAALHRACMLSPDSLTAPFLQSLLRLVSPLNCFPIQASS